ncbi:ABC transporter ATP-binding protein [Citricoccus muralis]|uniref:ATP-binding cassette domain-containing protein n=1 Tax=Citricoccus muralis TaxID=169134 RepID=A0ABY8H4K6_9MICC|nr:ATP-binding cassette domain-containing protein [Citricoccus muralis]WFP16073.1 ATP-binding cassette domain-containing protein [Citricoccus muralis]
MTNPTTTNTTVPHAPVTSATAAATVGVAELHHVSLSYPDGTDEQGRPRTVTALDSVSLTAARKQVTALMGESGSGKSSLLSVLATLITPSSGSVRLDGVEVTDLSEAQRARMRRERIGIIFQQPNLLTGLTAEEQLLVTDHVRGVRGRRLRARRDYAQELLDTVGLAGMGQRRVHQLSGGQRQRVNIARALMGQPTLLLADEPTSALDESRSHEIMALLAEVTARFELASVIVTHDRDLVDYTDAQVVLRDGAVSSTTAAGSAAGSSALV